MVVLYCDAVVARRYRLGLDASPPPSANRLGGWILASCPAGDRELMVFANAATELIVLCPSIEFGDLLLTFKARLGRLLEELGILEEEVAREIDEMATFSFARTEEAEWLERGLSRLSAAASGAGMSAASANQWQRDWARLRRPSLGRSSPAEVCRRLLAEVPTVH